MNTLSFSQKQELGSLLEKLAQSIDLTETQNHEASERYKSVGDFLSDPSGILSMYNPKIVPQGSIRIGTAVRPVKEECEFDVDATCRLDVSLPEVQAFVKSLVGNKFKSDGTYTKMLEEKTRCWRLKYAEASRFHMDIVPAIPDNFQWLLNLGVPQRYAEHAIKITDKEHVNYNIDSSDLPRSNPEGYALWFLDVMKVQAEQIRIKLAAELRMSVDRVPEYKVRTPLQRSIQIMKRHRDIMYGDNDLKPISIIITTLAAKAYSDVITYNQSTLFYEIVLDIVERMPSYILSKNGIKWISNPVNPNENFADKWQWNKLLEDNFYKWHGALLSTLRNEKLIKNHADMTEHLRLSFGTRSVNEALNNHFGYNDEQRENYLRKAAGLISSGGAFTNKLGHIVSSNDGVKNHEHRFHFSNPIKIPRRKDYKFAYLQSQKLLIEKHYSFLKCRIEKNVLICIGWLQPAGCKEAYKIKIEHVVGKEPKTTILYPEIQPLRTIHMYPDHSLCLHYSPDMKWTESTKVYQYTIPWITEWIIFYELYLINGSKWEGKESPEHLTMATINQNEDIV